MAGLVTKRCRGCDHLSTDCCLYILNEERMRPCPAGEGCTEHTERRKKGKETMPAEKKWDMETAARLLQYGATGKAVAEAVGCSPAEISRRKDELLSMVVEPLSQNEADKLLKKREPFKLSSAPEAAPETPEMRADARRAPLPIEVGETKAEADSAKKAVALPDERKPKAEIIVDIDIGKGRAHLEAEDTKTLKTIVAMLSIMTQNMTEE